MKKNVIVVMMFGVFFVGIGFFGGYTFDNLLIWGAIGIILGTIYIMVWDTDQTTDVTNHIKKTNGSTSKNIKLIMKGAVAGIIVGIIFGVVFGTLGAILGAIILGIAGAIKAILQGGVKS